MIRRALALVLLALAALAAIAPQRDGAAAEPAALRPGGVNAQPSMRPWRYAGANPDGWFCPRRACNGVANGTAFVDRELPLIAGLGARTVRVEFPWALLEPRRGRYAWGRADYIVRAARRLGLEVQPVLVYSPGWAAPGRSAPPRARDWRGFVSAFARRYRSSIRHVELWNEPDLPRYWRATQGEYVRTILVPGYRAVKSASPRMQVIVGGPSRPDLAWIEALYRLGGGASFDVMAFHDYSADRRILEAARAVRALLAAHGQPRKPIWLGEYSVEEAGLDDRNQTALVWTVLTAPAPLAMAQWYTLRDGFTMTCCPPARLGASHFGLVTSGYAKKRAYETMRQLLRARAAG